MWPPHRPVCMEPPRKEKHQQSNQSTNQQPNQPSYGGRSWPVGGMLDCAPAGNPVCSDTTVQDQSTVQDEKVNFIIVYKA